MKTIEIESCNRCPFLKYVKQEHSCDDFIYCDIIKSCTSVLVSAWKRYKTLEGCPLKKEKLIVIKFTGEE